MKHAEKIQCKTKKKTSGNKADCINFIAVSVQNVILET
jgi:hypothetical protein